MGPTKTKILFVDDEQSRYLALLSKKQLFADLLKLEEVQIDWVATWPTWEALDLWSYQMIMLDHDMGEGVPDGVVYARNLIHRFESLVFSSAFLQEGQLPKEMWPIIWVHSSNVPRAQQMAAELVGAGFSLHLDSFPSLISRL